MLYNYIHCTGLCCFNEMKDIRHSHLLFLGCVSVCLCVCACVTKIIHMSGPGVGFQGGACVHLASSHLLIFVPMCECACVCFIAGRKREREKHSDTVVHESLFMRATV